jgi:hypothetical protein
MTVKGGIIEWLATGQQFLAAGTHKDGQRYEWEPALPLVFPERTLEELDEFWEGPLARAFATEPVKPRRRLRRRPSGERPVTLVTDPLAAYLLERGWTQASDAEPLYGACPWKSEHTSDSGITETAYFPAGTGGYEMGHIRCLHAHCQERTDADFFDAIGWTKAHALEGFEIIAPQAINEKSLALEHEPSDEDLIGTDPAVPAVLDGPKFERVIKTGEIKAKINNVLLWLRQRGERGYGIGFDICRGELIQFTPEGGRRPFTDPDYTALRSQAETSMGLSKGFAPVTHEMMRHGVHLVARERFFDSLHDWIMAIPPHDGEPRIDTFCERYLGAEPGGYSRVVGRYLWTAMAGRLIQPGVKADMALILVSEQGTGKSTAVEAMAPFKEAYVDLSLSDKDADLARLIRGVSLVELPELRGLYTREMEHIKAFVTRSGEAWVPKYEEFSTRYPRRCVLIGTTNEDDFLSDTSGHRRWLPIRVGHKQDVEAIRRDHAQLWAEARDLFQRYGVLWQEAQALARLECGKFEVDDSWAQKFGEWLEEERISGIKNRDREYFTLKDVLWDVFKIEVGKQTRGLQMAASTAMKRNGLVRFRKREGNRTFHAWMFRYVPT